VANTVEIKIPEDIEFRVIGNAFGMLIASAGLLAGEMLRLRSFDYWLADIVPLLILIWSGFRLFRNFLSTMNAYQDAPSQGVHHASAASRLQGERVIAGQIASKPSYSADKVIEEVAKRIESQKADALKKNKFTN
jgi:ABC-type nickel/cobalt efflux system permease component RcnA